MVAQTRRIAVLNIRNKFVVRSASVLALAGMALSTGCDQANALLGVAKLAVVDSVQQTVTATVAETFSGIVGGVVGGVGGQTE
jgi:hypothetical protein